MVGLLGAERDKSATVPDVAAETLFVTDVDLSPPAKLSTITIVSCVSLPVTGCVLNRTFVAFFAFVDFSQLLVLSDDLGNQTSSSTDELGVICSSDDAVVSTFVSLCTVR